MNAFNKFYHIYWSWYLIISWIILTIIYLFNDLSAPNVKHYDITSHTFINMNIYQSYVIYIVTFGLYSQLGFLMYLAFYLNQ